MGKYILRCTLLAFVTLLAVVTLTCFLMRSIPGDPLAGMARALPEETKAAFMAKYGLDKPLFEQYLIYMKGLLTEFDLGESLRYAGRPVMKTIAETSPVSGLYGGIALLIGTLADVILGIVVALNKNKMPDYVVMFIAILGTTLPVFVLISLTQWFFGVKLQILPPSGWGTWQHMVMPVAVGTFAGANPSTANFSLIAKGYRVENGQRGRGVVQITIAGNFFEMLQSVCSVGNEASWMAAVNGCVYAPSLHVGQLAVSGEG